MYDDLRTTHWFTARIELPDVTDAEAEQFFAAMTKAHVSTVISELIVTTPNRRSYLEAFLRDVKPA